MPNAIMVLHPGFEEIEAVAPADILRRAGVDLTLASLTPQLAVLGRCGLTVLADTTLDAVADRVWDALVLPGGPGVKGLRADPRVAAMVHRHHEAGKWLAAICAAPLVLADAGLLQGRRYTAHSSAAAELPERLGGERTVWDGPVLTSRGAGTALDFGLALVARLVSPEKASEIARAIEI